MSNDKKYSFHQGYDGQKFINKQTGEIFNDVDAYNRSWYVKDSPAYAYFTGQILKKVGEK